MLSRNRHANPVGSYRRIIAQMLRLLAFEVEHSAKTPATHAFTAAMTQRKYQMPQVPYLFNRVAHGTYLKDTVTITEKIY